MIRYLVGSAGMLLFVGAYTAGTYHEHPMLAVPMAAGILLICACLYGDWWDE
jgi:hypothetical protein